MLLDAISDAPNPQFARLPFEDLTGSWGFSFDDDDQGIAERWFLPGNRLDHTITVPYPPESELSGIHDPSYHRIFWYRREFADPRRNAGERLLLRFGAVDYNATVWVDGVYVGSHEGGSTPFSFDIADALEPGQDDHVVTVRAMDDPIDREQPRGKQSWTPLPEVIHYERTSGIWQPVWLEVVPAVHIDDIRWTFDRASWTVGVDISLNRPALDGTRASLELSLDDDIIGSASCSMRGRQMRATVDLRNGLYYERLHKLLWSPSSPTLLGATISLTAPDNGEDRVLSYTGLRTVSTDSSHLLINNEAVFLRMVLSQGYWPESHLAAPSPEALRREVELVLELGFNGARLHQKVEDPRLLYWADRLGLLLWGEIGAAFAYSDRAIDRHAREWREAVLRDRNHPSVIAWVPFNESWGVDDVAFQTAQQHAVKAAYHAAHQLDGTRPVIGNDGWENVIGDIFTAHDYNWNPDTLQQRYGSDPAGEDVSASIAIGFRRLVVGDYSSADKPMMLSEFGGVSFAPNEGEKWFGYGRVQSQEEFIQKYAELVHPVSTSDRLAGFCYTQLTDTLQETNGLLTERREPKAPLDVLRSLTIGTHGPRVRPVSQSPETSSTGKE